jgi:exodeoxyribonuclease VII small subunit
LKNVANNKESPRGPAAGALSGQPPESPRFEDELGNLEAIVTQIDSGELSLEEAITAFERGVGLVRSLNQRLDEAEGRVELLMRGAGGALRSSPLEGANNVSAEEDTMNGSDPPQNGRKEDEDIPF